MNRPGIGPQSLRGLPNGFSSQQQLPQPRGASSRLPNGKIASNGGTWAFGGTPMGTSPLTNTRSNAATMTSFAQTIGASQTGTPLDLSEFPSLSNNQHQQVSTSAQSTWAMPNTRNLSQAASQRPQQSLQPLHQPQTQQQTQSQQDDLFATSSQLPTSQASFRFGAEIGASQPSQLQPTSDEFPPLNRNVNGEIGQDRVQGNLPSVGFGAQSRNSAFGSGLSASQNVRNNGLLNALSGSSRGPPSISQGASSGSIGGAPVSRLNNDQTRQTAGNSLENELNELNGFGRSNYPGVSSILSPRENGSAPISTGRLGPKSELSLHTQSISSQTKTNDFATAEDPSPDVEDPLAGMNDKDRFGIKGLLAVLKGPHPDQAALVTGIDIATLGFDLNTTERLSEMIWSPWDDNLARPDIPKYTLPECYQVHNVQPIENKLSNFSDETLMFMFYSNPQDIQQMIAAQELTNRNWRYHKKLQIWLTKDDMMLPQPVNAGSERGYYIFFDPKTWSRDRREFVLTYSDLETFPSSGPPGPLS